MPLDRLLRLLSPYTSKANQATLIGWNVLTEATVSISQSDPSKYSTCIRRTEPAKNYLHSQSSEHVCGLSSQVTLDRLCSSHVPVNPIQPSGWNLTEATGKLDLKYSSYIRRTEPAQSHEYESSDDVFLLGISILVIQFTHLKPSAGPSWFILDISTNQATWLGSLVIGEQRCQEPLNNLHHPVLIIRSLATNSSSSWIVSKLKFGMGVLRELIRKVKVRFWIFDLKALLHWPLHNPKTLPLHK